MTGGNGFIIPGKVKDQHLGFSINRVGDIDHDGIADFLTSAPGVATGLTESYLLFGSKQIGASGQIYLNNLLPGQGITFLPMAEGERNGISLADADDLNGDRYDDLLIGADDIYFQGTGKVYAVFGSPALKNITTFSLALLNGSNGFITTGKKLGDNGFAIALSKAKHIKEYAANSFFTSSFGGASESYLIYGASEQTFSLTLGSLTIAPNQSVVLTSNHINASCVNYNASSITLIIQQINNGILALRNNTSATIKYFTQQQINLGEIILTATHASKLPILLLIAQAGFWQTKPQWLTWQNASAAPTPFESIENSTHSNDVISYVILFLNSALFFLLALSLLLRYLSNNHVAAGLQLKHKSDTTSLYPPALPQSICITLFSIMNIRTCGYISKSQVSDYQNAIEMVLNEWVKKNPMLHFLEFSKAQQIFFIETVAETIKQVVVAQNNPFFCMRVANFFKAAVSPEQIKAEVKHIAEKIGVCFSQHLSLEDNYKSNPVFGRSIV